MSSSRAKVLADNQQVQIMGSPDGRNLIRSGESDQHRMRMNSPNNRDRHVSEPEDRDSGNKTIPDEPHNIRPIREDDHEVEKTSRNAVKEESHHHPPQTHAKAIVEPDPRMYSGPKELHQSGRHGSADRRAAQVVSDKEMAVMLRKLYQTLNPQQRAGARRRLSDVVWPEVMKQFFNGVRALSWYA